jgi:hypothetical protein
MDIGTEKPAITVEPVEDPFRVPATPVETPETAPAETEKVPA